MQNLKILIAWLFAVIRKQSGLCDIREIVTQHYACIKPL